METQRARRGPSRWHSLVGILLALLLAAAVVMLTAPRVFAEEEREPLAVVATLPVLGALAGEIGGDRIAVEVLSHPDQDPHYVQPRPTLMKKVRKADVFIELGLGMEIWAQKVVDGAGNPRVALGKPGRIVASAGVATIDRPTSVSRALGHIHPQGNPHIWLDPLRSRRMAATIAAGLSRVAPASKAYFEAGLEKFVNRLDRRMFGDALVDEMGGEKLVRLAESGALETYLSEQSLEGQLAGWMGMSKKLGALEIVTYHTTWAYFGNRFGIAIPIHIEEKPGIAPSAKHRDAVVALVEEREIAALVTTTFYDQRAVDYVAERTGTPVLVLPVEPSDEIGDRSYAGLIDHIFRELGGLSGVSDALSQ